MKIVVRELLRAFVRLFPKNRQVLVLLLVLLALMVASKATAGQYEYRGVYPVKSVMVNYCASCYLQLPPDYLNSEFVLAVDTDKESEVFKALKTASKAIGWDLRKGSSGLLQAEPLENVGNLVFISCMDLQPRNVPKYMYSAARQADSLQCVQRDSVRLSEIASRDSAKRVRDSLAALPPLDFAGYELRYYSYSKSMTDKMGLEWSAVLAAGNLHDRFRVFDDWQFWATANNDTSYTSRILRFALDTLVSIDWGSEEQSLRATYVNDGVTSSDYEWRKYGLLVNIQRDNRRVKMQYTFRDKDNSVSVLQGSAVGTDGDTLRLNGVYTTSRRVTQGIPVLSALPIVGYLFSTQSTSNDVRAFELYLIPKRHGENDETNNTRN